jgi:hypothetical protein
MEKNFRPESNQEKINHFMEDFFIGEAFSKYPKDKKELYESIQNKWRDVVKKENLFPEKLEQLENLSTIDVIKEICQKLSKTNPGYGSSPGLRKLIGTEDGGLDCLAASMIVGSYLEDKNINYNYVSPVGHIAIIAEIDNKKYYIDPRNNKVLDVSNFIQQIVDDSDSSAFSRIDLNTKEEDKIYSFMFQYNDKENIVDAITGNIFVLKELSQGVEGGAYHDLDNHKKAAEIIKNKTSKIDVSLIQGNQIFKKEEDFFDKNKELIEKEEQRLKDVGFYSS